MSLPRGSQPAQDRVRKEVDGHCPSRVLPFVVVLSDESGGAPPGARDRRIAMTDPLSSLVMQTFAARSVRSALPDAPVTPARRRGRISVIGAFVRRATDQEA
jgi:hypothetical protein